VCVFVTRGVIVQAHPLAVMALSTQHSTTRRTHARAHMHAEREREREREERTRERERGRGAERERDARARAHTHAHTHEYTVVVLYDTFVGFHNTYAGDFGPIVTSVSELKL
jgi:hypothetical protein